MMHGEVVAALDLGSGAMPPLAGIAPAVTVDDDLPRATARFANQFRIRLPHIDPALDDSGHVREPQIGLILGAYAAPKLKAVIGMKRESEDAQHHPLRLAGLLWRGLMRTGNAADQACLVRLGLARPTTFSERVYRALVSAALAR